ncbi:MAG TPA: FmdB family zinc ribbon protein [Candidatus Limnocylindria bacterium]|nr:FmdB family zinc ribbon protein [Candidatus Limnocylindria bacterium]
MPIYDYTCDHCGHVFSAVQSYTDATLEKCPSCGKKPRKLMATPAIVFKGGGWYKTDSRATPKDEGATTPAKTEPAKADTAAAAKTEAPKAETTTAAKKREAASS